MKTRWTSLILLLAIPLTSLAGPPRTGPRHPPLGPCSRDVEPPAVVLTLQATGTGTLAVADSTDACGVAFVLFSVEGDLVAGRLEEPWSSLIDVPPGARACALAVDRSGNSALACADAGQPPAACQADGDCAPGEYCHFPDGACAPPGTCEPRPEVCPALFDPVCGCEGQTWPSACDAALAGVSLAHRGECP